jgi:hypothetical protein
MRCGSARTVRRRPACLKPCAASPATQDLRQYRVICGSENPDYARFCRKCGRVISEGVEDRKREEPAPQERTAMPTPRNAPPDPPHLPSLGADRLKVDEFAAHYRNLTTDELGSLSKGIDDLLPEARAALEAELRTRPGPSEDAPSQRLPYRWGMFQGWVSLVVGLFAAVFLIPAFVSGASLDESSKGYAIMSPLLVASGYAFVRRKKYAVVMTYLWIGFNALVFLVSLLDGLTNKSLTPEQQGNEIGRGLGQAVTGIVFWGLCAIYYHKRRSEFAAELPSKSLPVPPAT